MNLDSNLGDLEREGEKYLRIYRLNLLVNFERKATVNQDRHSVQVAKTNQIVASYSNSSTPNLKFLICIC